MIEKRKLMVRAMRQPSYGEIIATVIRNQPESIFAPNAVGFILAKIPNDAGLLSIDELADLIRSETIFDYYTYWD